MTRCELTARPTYSQMTNQFGLIWSLNQRCFSFFFSNNFFPGFDVFESGGQLIREVPEGEKKRPLKWCYEWKRWISVSIGRGWALWYKAKHIQYQRRNSTTLDNALKSFLRILISKDLPKNVLFTWDFFFMVHWRRHRMVFFWAHDLEWGALETPLRGKTAPWGVHMHWVTKCVWSSSWCSCVWLGFRRACFGN